MKKALRILFSLFLITSSVITYAQTGTTIKGRVLSKKDNTPVDFASIFVKSLKDSATVATVQSNKDGSFSLPGIKPGQYRLHVAFLGYNTGTKDFSVQANSGRELALGNIALEDDGIQLAEVKITGDVPVVVKTDTLEVDAKNIKVRENAVIEDLLKKVPGVDVDKDGNVKAQGETITKVKIDGKEFFGSDPLLATKNLPADMVDKIQIIDEMSEQSQFTGIDDGNRSKILNITTKSGANRGYFSNASVGYGTEDTYDANLNISKFNNDERITLMGQLNNVNKQNFGGGGFGGGGGRMSFGGGGGGNDARGITKTLAGGLNYSNTFKDGTELQGSYFINNAKTTNNSLTESKNLFGERVQLSNQNKESLTELLNHRLNFTLDTKFDKTFSMRLRPSFSYSNNESNNLTLFNTENPLTNTSGRQEFNTKSTTPNFSNNLLLRKSFARRGRTLSLNVNTSINNSTSENFNYENKDTDESGIITNTVTNQFNDVINKSFNNTSRLVYTEPLSRTFNIELNYQNGLMKSNSNRNVFDFNPLTNQFDLINTDYTNDYDNFTLTNALGVSFTKTEKDYNFNFGVAAQQTHRENVNVTKDVVRTQNFINLTPSAQFRYNFSRSKRLNISYRGTTSQPSIDQIQPIKDNTNTQTVFTGNPDLKPAFNNTLRISYNNFNFEKGQMFFAFITATQSFNNISRSSQLIDDPSDLENNGKQAVTYINTNGVYNLFANATWSTPLIKPRKLVLNISGNANVSRDVNFIADRSGNSLKNITNNFGLSNTYKLVSNLDKFDLTGGITGGYNRSNYSAQPNQNITYYTLNPTFDISYLMPGNIRIATTIDYYKNFGGGDLYNKKYTIINPYISKQLFQNRGTLKFAVNDLLNQNTGVSLTTTGTSQVNQQFTVLKRYYMVSFTYALNRVAGKILGGDAQMPGATMRGRGHGM